MTRLSPAQQGEVLALLARGLSVREVCRRYHCHHDTIDRLRTNTPVSMPSMIALSGLAKQGRAVSTIVGRNIARERLRHNLSVQQLAQRSGISESYIAEIEKRPSRPAAETIFQIARSLGVSMESLLDEEGESAVVISEALWICAKQYTLPYADTVMLSRIRHAGRQPATPEGWWQLYHVLLAILEYEL